MSAFKLCYVDEDWAWFTTAELQNQWGDDWDDSPYEHNAGDPYEWREGRDIPPYELKKVAFESPYETPNYAALNSPWSVRQINAGQIAWLRDIYNAERPHIMAGTLYEDFVRLIQQAGGAVYEAVPVVTAEKLEPVQ